MPRILLIYRREDTAHQAIPKIMEKLKADFEKAKIETLAIDRFTSAESAEADVLQHHALIVIVGRYWLNVLDEGGQRLLENPDDPLVRAMQIADNHDLYTAIYLYDGTPLPDVDDLPATIQPYCENADTITENLSDLIKDLQEEKWLGEMVWWSGSEDSPREKKRSRRWRRERLAAYGVFGMIILMLYRFVFGNDDSDDSRPPVPQLVPRAETIHLTITAEQITTLAGNWNFSTKPITAHNIEKFAPLYVIREKRYRQLALSSNGLWLAASDGQWIDGYDLTANNPLSASRMEITTSPIIALAFKPDSRNTVAFVTQSGTGGLWSIGSPFVKPIRRMKIQRGQQLVYRDKQWTWEKRESFAFGVNLTATLKRDTLIVTDSRLQGDVAHITIPKIADIASHPTMGLIAILMQTGEIVLCGILL